MPEEASCRPDPPAQSGSTGQSMGARREDGEGLGSGERPSLSSGAATPWLQQVLLCKDAAHAAESSDLLREPRNPDFFFVNILISKCWLQVIVNTNKATPLIF